MQYRLFLYDSDNHIRAADAYSAPSDCDAVEIGSAIQSAMSDQFERFEVWRGAQSIGDIRGLSRLTATELIDKHEDIVLDLEERLNRSFASIKRSRILLETLDRLQEKRWHSSRPLRKK